MRPSRSRAGFTLVELLIGMVVAAVVGAALVRFLMSDMQFQEDREAWRTARQAARAGVTVLTSDLRMVETGGGIETADASGQDLTIRVPYAMGVLCATDGATSTVALLPADSLMFTQPGHSGFAWRDENSGSYTYVSAGTVSGGSAGPCTIAGIAVVSGGQVVSLGGTVPSGLVKGTVFLLYRRIRYEIKASVTLSGQTALWRTQLATGASEELAAPFNPGSRFRFFVDGGTTAQDAVPSPLADIIGLELVFEGRSDRTPRKAAGPKVVPFSTAIFFQNQSS
ncbi:MAG TPA: prepilin-type N-terminal cleavage/methylation domain-containing protein [Gemmatimonadales bacterium]